MATTGRIKTEPGVKPDPDAGSPAVMDEDVYEDAGDLEFWDPNIEQNPYGNAYLVRIPDYLWEIWSELDDDAEIQVGTMRQWATIGQNGEEKTHLRMLLNTQLDKHQPLPKEYELEIKDMQLTNTFLFSEKDLPGYKSTQGGDKDIPARLRTKPVNRQQEKDKQQPQAPAGGRKGRYQPYYRKAIPKKTAIAGRFRHELNCTPVDNDETKHILRVRALEAMKPKATTTIRNMRDIKGTLVQAGTARANDKFGSFVKTTAEPKKGKKQKAERAARIPENELLDTIFHLFVEWRYWPMRALKEKLNQPEAWIRETMEKVAVLHKSGKFANKWELRPEYKTSNMENSKDAAAPDVESSEDEDEDVQMEDVVASRAV